MIAFKAFNKDLTCTSGSGVFQYKEGQVITDTVENKSAKCAHNGLHATTEPFGVLQYYDWKNSVIYLVVCGGDIHEDASGDTRLACTKMKLVKKLTAGELVALEIKYLAENPHEDVNSRYVLDGNVSEEELCGKPFAVIRGMEPCVDNVPDGCLVGIMKTDNMNRLVEWKIIDRTLETEKQ